MASVSDPRRRAIPMPCDWHVLEDGGEGNEREDPELTRDLELEIFTCEQISMEEQCDHFGSVELHLREPRGPRGLLAKATQQRRGNRLLWLSRVE